MNSNFKISSFFTLFISLFVLSCTNSHSLNHKGDVEQEWIILFDGTSADAWRGFKQESLPVGWSIKDGTLITSGEGGDLGGDIISKAQFEDFHLQLEWKIDRQMRPEIY